MKKSLKLISVLLVFAIMTTFTAISGSALATPLDAENTEESTTNIAPDPEIPASKRLTRINIDTLPLKTTYAIGENFSTAGMFVSAKYADGSSKRIEDYTVSGFDSSAEGVSVVTISYTESGITKTATISCTIVTAIENTENDDNGGFSIDSIFSFLAFLVSLITKASRWLIDSFANLELF